MADLQTIQQFASKINPRFSLIFEALSDQRRLQILRLLTKYSDLCVSEIASVFKITTSAASQQLTFLEMTGLVRKIRKGQMICFEIQKKDPLVKEIMKVLFKS